MAVAQFHSLERKLAKQPKTARQYKDFINEYKDLGHMSFIENKGPEIGYYLPHHCVTREHSETTKLRVVFNGSAKTTTGLSLNDVMIVAWILRLLPKNKDKRERYLTLAEVKEAKRKIIRNVQEDDFFYEIEKLRRKESINKSTLIALNPYLGQDGLLRVGGRLRNAFISKDMQHPIIISHTGRLTDLIIDQAHKLTFHGGPRLTLSLIRQKYWIVGGNRAVKRQLRLCVTCVKNNPRMQYQIMGDFPEARYLVAIHDANTPPGKWAMGRVVELHPGTDNIVRVVSLKTKNRVIKRPIVK
ncbi:uncharacterized protein LOC123718350 [Pieris brassicae]|uniref:uncharacterized protein LOC123718350 n=1 Tax=Pieris brassicae TaxID=7116 RepID=UPI001E65E74F|nr:uncharacterized protein LOC123718350 [Pieris brassicae]